MIQISNDIGEIDSSKSKPVTFLGSIAYNNSRYNDNFAKEATVNSYFTWDRSYDLASEKESERINLFFDFHGYTLNIGYFDTEENLRREYDSMPHYPQDGYVKDCGEYILVKLGDNTNLPD